MLRLQDVARELRCSLRTVQKLAQSGELKAVRIGRLVRVRRIDFEAFLEALPS